MLFRSKTIGKDSILLQLNYGEGIGRYILEAGGRAASQTTTATSRSLDTQTAFGGILSYQHFWTDNIRSTAAYGYASIDNNTASFTTAGLNTLDKRIQTVHVNAIYSPISRIDLGIEYIYARREVEAADPASGIGSTGTVSRFQFGAKYKF